jgi:hypothetical protein
MYKPVYGCVPRPAIRPAIAPIVRSRARVASIAWPRHRAALLDGFVRTLAARERERQHPDWPGEAALLAALSALIR